ncbi:MAG: hypothetical protein FGM32_10680 [Candidatus Kapabacteria bacterium]|nr:hypothetical protein [Candidatus Kapabacteria bacterium]
MKTIILAVTAIIALVSANAQCPTSTSATFKVTIASRPILSGQPLVILPRSGETLPKAALVRMSARIDDVPASILSANDGMITVATSAQLSEGKHSVAICISDGPFATDSFDVEVHRDTLDGRVNKTDPDPSTQNGDRLDLSGGDRRPRDGTVNDYPNGGHGGTLNCIERHKIDGRFTQLRDGSREWNGITPMVGRFSTLYLDYCAERKVMYLMNDWLIGSSQYNRSCYNLFDFTTGNGSEHWRIKVTHDSANPVIVVLNGKDVTKDTNLVIGGGYGYGPSPSDTTPHTIYEFAVVVSEGLFIIPTGSDPVQYIPSTVTSLECDDNGVEGWGLIREPSIRTANFGSDGVKTQQYERYIPQGGIIGLEKEPNDIAGNIEGGTVTYRSGSQATVTNPCSGVGVIDGMFSPGEWAGSKPASGLFSDLYAQYCNGELHILNDWIYATRVPNGESCYNLFELFTGNGREHWGIWVWQDSKRKPTVIRNGVDVSDDTTIVEAGKAGWGSSARMAEPHAIYEFRIKTMEGGFALQYADPGPASFCTVTTSVDDRLEQPHGRVRPNVVSRSNPTFLIADVQPGSTIHIIDVQGRIIHSVSSVEASPQTITLPHHVGAGRYTIRIANVSGIAHLPLLITM